MSDSPRRLGVRALARELGVSAPAIVHATKNGRIEKGEDGKYDLDSSRERFRKAHPIQQANARKQQPEERKTAASTSAAFGDTPDAFAEGVNDGSLAEAVRREKWLKVQKEQLIVRERMGALLPADEVREYVSGMILEAKEALLRVPGELKAVLAGETDMNRIEHLLMAEMHRALGRLRQFRPSQQAAA